jgi:hypothetical protein
MTAHPIIPSAQVQTVEGLWTAEFGSSAGIFGGGVAIFRDGKIWGGDGGYFYIGEYELKGNNFRATIKICPFIEGYESAFKTVGQNLTLDLSGSFTDSRRGIAQGHPRELPDLNLGVKLTKRA